MQPWPAARAPPPRTRERGARDGSSRLRDRRQRGRERVVLHRRVRHVVKAREVDVVVDDALVVVLVEAPLVAVRSLVVTWLSAASTFFESSDPARVSAATSTCAKS